MRAEVGGDGVEVLSSRAVAELGSLDGHSDTEVEWLLRLEPEAEVRLKAWHPKAGVATMSLAVAPTVSDGEDR